MNPETFIKLRDLLRDHCDIKNSRMTWKCVLRMRQLKTHAACSAKTPTDRFLVALHAACELQDASSTVPDAYDVCNLHVINTGWSSSCMLVARKMPVAPCETHTCVTRLKEAHLTQCTVNIEPKQPLLLWRSPPEGRNISVKCASVSVSMCCHHEHHLSGKPAENPSLSQLKTYQALGSSLQNYFKLY